MIASSSNFQTAELVHRGAGSQYQILLERSGNRGDVPAGQRYVINIWCFLTLSLDAKGHDVLLHIEVSQILFKCKEAGEISARELVK